MEKRRDFIKKMTVATAAVAIGNKAFGISPKSCGEGN